MASRSEVERAEQRTQNQPCFRDCGGCGGCREYRGSLQKCAGCTHHVQHLRCQCGQGVRRWLGQDGHLKMKFFGKHDKSGRRVDLGPVITGPSVCQPVPGAR